MIDVTGLTINEILSMDTRNYNTKDLRKIANRLVSATNKRIRRLKKANKKMDYTIPSLKHLKEKNRSRQFSIKHAKFKGKKAEQKERGFLLKKISKMQEFNKLKTSTIKGARSVEKEITTRLGKGYTDLNKVDKNKFWELYEKVVEERPEIVGSKNKSKEIQKETLKIYQTSLTEEEKKVKLKEFLDTKYKEMYEEEIDEDFDLDIGFEDDLPF